MTRTMRAMKKELGDLLQAKQVVTQDKEALEVRVRKLEEHLAKASRQLGKAVARELQLEAGVAGVRQAMARKRQEQAAPQYQPDSSFEAMTIQEVRAVTEDDLRRAAAKTNAGFDLRAREQRRVEAGAREQGRAGVGAREGMVEVEEKTLSVADMAVEVAASHPKKRKMIQVVVEGEVQRNLGVKERERLIPRLVKEEVKEGFSCDICAKKFTSAATLVAHTSAHHDEATIPCAFDGCSYRGGVVAMVRHTRSIHTKEKLFECKDCGKAMPSYDALQKHEKNHRDPSLVFCPSCSCFKTGRGCTKKTCQ